MRQIIVTSVIAILFLALGFGGFNALKNSKPAPEKLEKVEQVKKIKTRTVNNASSEAKISITGRLDAKQEIQVFSEVGGTYIRGARSFREGNYFKKDEDMILIEHDEFDLNLLAQKSSLMNQITLMLPDMKTDYPTSFPKWEAYMKEMDVNKSLKPLPEPASDKERYYLSSRNIYNLFYSIQSQEVRRDKYTIKAPFSGKVSQTSITEGTLVRAGQLLGEFYNPYFYELEAAVSLKDLEFVKPGSKVVMKSNDIEGSWTGTVARISDVIDPATQTVKIFVNVRGKGLKEGMYLEGQVSGASIKDVAEIPRSYVIGDNQIWIKNDSTLALHTIEPIKYSTDVVLVKGIPNGTVIVDEAIVGAYEGMKVASY
ncbi:MAG: efflux RND transporter periplasmic adaptor subunit [Bacteroidota bacterium]